MSFSYLIDKVRDAEFASDPFKHLYLRPFLSEAHFAQVIGAPEIDISGVGSDEALFERLFEHGFEVIKFGGSTTDWMEYVKSRKAGGGTRRDDVDLLEGYGVTLRLAAPKSALIQEMTAFLAAEEFRLALAEKFSLKDTDLDYDGGIQKYLDGYGIYPHPDIRNKALTYMVNINPTPESETRRHHTHYLRLKPEYQYVKTFWDGNPDLERCRVPWDWCETVKEQRENNSAMFFSPSNETMHAVDANYDHLIGQRTQLFGNLWYKNGGQRLKPNWKDLNIRTRAEDRVRSSAAKPLV